MIAYVCVSMHMCHKLVCLSLAQATLFLCVVRGGTENRRATLNYAPFALTGAWAVIKRRTLSSLSS